MKMYKKILATLGFCGAMTMASTANAGVMLGGYGGYGFGLSDGLDLTITYGGTLEFMVTPKVSLGGYFDLQTVDLGFLGLTANLVSYGGTVNFWVSPKFYIGGNVGLSSLSYLGTSSDGDITFGGQAGVGLPLSSMLMFGVEGRYIMVSSDPSQSFAQALGKLILTF